MRIIRTALVSFVITFTVFLIIAAVLVFAVFKVETIECTETKRYSSQTVIEASEIKTGDELILISKASVKEKIEKKLPYTDNVEVLLIIPGDVKISYEITSPVYYDASSGCLLNESFKVLGKGKKQGNYISFEGLSGSKNKVGENANLYLPGSSEVFYNDALSEIYKFVKENKNNDFVSFKFISSGRITADYNGRVTVELGDKLNLYDKLALAAKTMEKENALSEKQVGTLYVKSGEKAVFSPGM